MNVRAKIAIVVLAGFLLAPEARAQKGTVTPSIEPLLRMVDLDIGQERQVTLHDGSRAVVELLSVDVQRNVVGAIRAAQATVEVNGEEATLEVGQYNLPDTVGGVQIDCPVVDAYVKHAHQQSWGLERKARLRLWPEDAPWIRPETFSYPLGQRFLASSTHFANEPSQQIPGGKHKYHAALDFGGAEGMDTAYAPVDGLVVSARDAIIPAHRETLVAAYGGHDASRVDDVYIQDARGWYHRYSHLDTVFTDVQIGEPIKQGQPVGLVGKRGTSGGWSHLHYEIKSRTPAGQWGVQNAYPFVWQAYLNKQDPEVIALARPRHTIKPGDTVTLDGTRSWAKGSIARYEWTFTDSTTATGPTPERTYEEPGVYSEILKVTDREGNVDYDIARVEVWAPLYMTSVGGGLPDWKVERGLSAPGIHAAFHPSQNIEPGEEVTFLVRARGTTRGVDVWHFGDGSAPDTTKSNTNQEYHPDVNEGGYATVTHRFEEPGHYLVRVQRRNQLGRAVDYLHVPVGMEK